MTTTPRKSNPRVHGSEADPTSQSSSLNSPEVTAALDEYLMRLQNGELPVRSQLLARFPDLADELADCLDGLELVHQFGQVDITPRHDANVTSEQTIPPRAALGDFRIVREIGRGGMGVVYEAEQLSLGRRVALKILPFASVLDYRQLQRFKNEAHAAAQLSHPHIVGVHFVGCERGVHYYAMELIDGPSLAELMTQLRRQDTSDRDSPSRIESVPGKREVETSPIFGLSTQRLDQPRDCHRLIADWCIQAADALEYAHQMGVIHRDVKPSNLLVDQNEKLWLTDFGLAQVQGDHDLTMTGDVLGTLRYMSPEQASGTKILDHRTDIYSLGITLYELLTRRPAFVDRDRRALLTQIVEQTPTAPCAIDRRIPKDLETIILKAISKEPSERYQTAQQMSDDLRRQIGGKSVLAKRPSVPQKVARWARGHTPTLCWTASLLLLALVGLSVATAVVTQERNRADQTAARRQEDLKQLIEVLDEHLFPAAETMGDRAGMQPLQRDLVESLLHYYEQIAERERDNPEMQFEMACAFRRAATIHLRMRRFEPGMAANRRAMQVFARLVQESPTDSEYRRELAEGHVQMGNAFWVHSQLRNSVAQYEQAISLFDRLAAESAERADYQLRSAECHVNIAGVYVNLDDAANAEHHITRALEHWQLSERLPADSDPDTYLRIRIHEHMGGVYMATRRFDMAVKERKLAVKLAEQNAASERSEDNDYLLVIEQDQYAQALILAQRPEEAEQVLRQAVSTMERLLSLRPESWYLTSSLANLYGSTSKSLLAVGRLSEAEVAMRQQIHRLERLTDVAEGDPSALGEAHFSLGLVLWYEGRRGESSTAFGRAQTECQTAMHAFPKHRQYRRHMALLLATCPDPRFRDATTAVRLAREVLLPADPGDHQLLGAALYRAGQWEAAIRALEEAAAKRNEKDPYDALLLAMAHWQLDDRQQASQWYTSAQQMFESRSPVCVLACDEPLLLDLLHAEAKQLMGR